MAENIFSERNRVRLLLQVMTSNTVLSGGNWDQVEVWDVCTGFVWDDLYQVAY